MATEGTRDRLLEAERYVDELESQPKSLGVLKDAIETIAKAKGLSLSITEETSTLHVKRGHHRYNVWINESTYHVNWMVMADMGKDVFRTLREAAWSITTGSTFVPSLIFSLYDRALRKLKREGRTPDPNGFISFDYMSRLTEDDK